MTKFLAATLACGLASSAVFAQTKPAAPAATTTITDNTPIITAGKVVVPFHEFEYVYKKNNAAASDYQTAKSVNEYVELYTNFKLKVQDAERIKLDTAPSFKQELEGYRKQLAQPYLTEKSVTEKLMKEAYGRMKEEVSASHILLLVDPQADPKDTLKAYNKILDLRKRALAGEDFAKLAKENSEDPSAKTNNGNLGYFSGMQMVYPFETAAFNTAKGQISQPVRTRFGYHIIKVVDRRPSQGQVQVAHIMVKANPGMPAEDSAAAVQKINEIYAKLKAGEKWSALAQTFSEDQSSKDRGGVLPPFSSGQMIPEFEDVAFKMKDTGSYSAPFRTQYGYHIVKLISKKPLETYEEMEPTLKTRVGRDSRSEQNKTALLSRLKKEDKFVEFPKVKAKALAKADTTMLSAHWRYKRADKLNKEVLFTINNDKYTVEDFYTYVEKTEAENRKSSPAYLMQLAYNAYADDALIKYEEKNLAGKYEDYRMLLKEYRDGILLFTLMDQKVWTKALEDTAGLRTYFNAHRDTYKYGQRAQATIYNVADQKTLDEVKKRIANRHYAVSEPAAGKVDFEKKSAKLTTKTMATVRTIAFNLRNDEALTAEITGQEDAGEKAGTAKLRANAVVDSLVKLGIDAKRIVTKPAAAKSKELAGSSVKVAYYSNSLKALERAMNTASPLSLQITEGKFQRGENAVLDTIKPWKVQEYTILDDPTKKGRITYVIISALDEPRAKTLDEAKGAAISDYQNYLEKAWITQLRKENPVTVNEAAVAKLIKK